MKTHCPQPSSATDQIRDHSGREWTLDFQAHLATAGKKRILFRDREAMIGWIKTNFAGLAHPRTHHEIQPL